MYTFSTAFDLAISYVCNLGPRGIRTPHNLVTADLVTCSTYDIRTSFALVAVTLPHRSTRLCRLLFLLRLTLLTAIPGKRHWCFIQGTSVHWRLHCFTCCIGRLQRAREHQLYTAQLLSSHAPPIAAHPGIRSTSCQIFPASHLACLGHLGLRAACNFATIGLHPTSKRNGRLLLLLRSCQAACRAATHLLPGRATSLLGSCSSQ